ncbi:MAG: alpha/beta fold hydrolase [Dehalococcoidales bacterium]|nr:alpha/beta fold hydrolase [Dehalococcoidales bacterium]
MSGGVEIQSKTIRVNGLLVHYYVAGRGEPLIVVHGGGGDARTWWANIAELAQKYTVYAPDLPGYGASQPIGEVYFIPELSEFLDDFATAIGLDRFYLIGHSLGGGVALSYTLKCPHKIKKLVLVSSLCLGREIAFWVRFLSVPAFIRSLGALTKAVLQGIRWVAERLNPAGYIMPLSPASITLGGSITSLRQQSLVLEDRLGELNVPTLLVWGTRDPIVPVEHAYRAAEVIPDGRVKIFSGHGHNVHREALSEFSRPIIGFLD